MIDGLNLIEKGICGIVSRELDKVGILYRIFSRSKDSKALNEKIQRKKDEGDPYLIDGKKIQDIVGIRVVTYFKDDVALVKEILNGKLFFKDEAIDTPDPSVFKPKRTNIICSFNTDQNQIFIDCQKASENNTLDLVDSTYELQLRTILSEGWHEIDHSLRYKCKSDWEGHSENERLLNGIYASLETNDIALKSLFNELAYSHYKNKNWEGLLRNKFRLRFQVQRLSDSLIKILNDDLDLGKKIIKLDRHTILKTIHNSNIILPVNLNNLLYQVNAIYLKSDVIKNNCPATIRNIIYQD